MVDNIRLTKWLTILAIAYTAAISIGASYLSAGISVLYTVPPLITEYSTQNTTKFQHDTVDNLTQSATNLCNTGYVIIGLSVLSAVLTVFRSEIRNFGKQSKLTSYTNNEHNMPRQNNINYTGNRYFQTRKQLSYHPEDKRFRG